MDNVQIRLSHLALMTGMQRRTLTYRAHELFDKNQIKRTSGNQIILDAKQVYSLIEDQFIGKKGKIICMAMRKGGVGKTFLSFFLTHLISSLGLKFCIIDLDQESLLTQKILRTGKTGLPLSTPVFVDIISKNVHPELGKKISISDIIIPIHKNLHIIPSTIKNTLIAQTIAFQRISHYENWLNDLCIDYLRSNYDVILIDTPAGDSVLLSSFYVCLDERDSILIPAYADQAATFSIGNTLNDIYAIRKEFKKNLNLDINVVINKKPTNRLSEEKFELEIQQLYGDFIWREYIPDNAQLSTIYNQPHLIDSIKDPKQFYDYIAFLLKKLKVLKGGE